MKLLFGMAALIVAIIITWWSVSSQEPGEIRSSGSERPEPHQTSATGSMAKGAANDVASIEPAERQAMLEAEQANAIMPPPAAGQTHEDTTRMEAATSIEPAERQAMLEAEQAIAMMPAPAAIQTGDTVEGDQSSTRKPLETEKEIAAVMEPLDSVSEEQPAVSRDNKGTWVINLASTPSKADADRIAKKASSRDIQTEQQQVTVKGRQYWRVQITGFSTAEDARAYADVAREKMGLKDVWIMKR